MSECSGPCACANSTEAKPAPMLPPIPGQGPGQMSLLAIPQMDCPSEERLIRMALDPAQGVTALEFDLAQRQLRLHHLGPVEPLLALLAPLNLGTRLVSTESAPTPPPGQSADSPEEMRVLRQLLAINAAMFVGEMAVGWLAQSTGLMADALDMLADAAVYGLALYAVGRAASLKLRAAHLSGWLQILLALGAFAEVARRAWLGSEPEPPLMMGMSLLALLANVASLLLLAKHRQSGVHMRASWIFSSNDVLANLGVLIAGALVAWTGKAYPDLIIGTMVAALVLNSARRILRLRGA